MNVTIIGTGNMGRAIGSRAVAGGHSVTLVGKTEEMAEEAAQAVREAGGDGEVSTAAAGGELGGEVVVLAVYYPDAREAVEQYRDQLAGTPVVDVTNPVNDSFDALVVPPDSSATQELAQLAPDAKFVKAFNTTFAGTVKAGEVEGQQVDVFLAGDDEDAKSKVAALVRDGGLNPVDTGAGHRARELEALGLLHMTLQGPLGTGFGSTVKVVTPAG